jgi:hypothetical protein
MASKKFFKDGLAYLKRWAHAVMHTLQTIQAMLNLLCGTTVEGCAICKTHYCFNFASSCHVDTRHLQITSTTPLDWQGQPSASITQSAKGLWSSCLFDLNSKQQLNKRYSMTCLFFILITHFFVGQCMSHLHCHLQTLRHLVDPALWVHTELSPLSVTPIPAFVLLLMRDLRQCMTIYDNVVWRSRVE